MSTDSVGPSDRAANKRKGASEGIRILLVEDDEADSIMIERCFHERSRHNDIVTHLLGDASAAVDGGTLIDELRRRNYDCVLMAQALPNGVDGIALCEAVRDALAEPPPIVLLAGGVGPAIRTRAKLAGVTSVVDNTQLTPDALRDVVDIAVKRQLDQ